MNTYALPEQRQHPSYGHSGARGRGQILQCCVQMRKRFGAAAT
jgi:hypothetical protein